jgi:hypothetical protein
MKPLPFLLSLALLTAARGGDFIPADKLLSTRKQLVFDHRAIAETQGVKLVLGQVAKEARNPLFQADQPWENALNNLYPNLSYDEQDRLFKLWYKCALPDPEIYAKMAPPLQLVNDVGWFLCYATSRDGLVWEKPKLGLQSFDGSTANNAVARDVANVGVFKDAHDPDAARRYKMIYDIGARLPDNMRVRFSPDGLHWSEPQMPAGLGSIGDTHSNAFWDERLGRYVLISRIYNGIRFVARSSSADFLNWEKPAVVLRGLPEESGEHQTYCMPVFRYANVYLGFVMMYHVKSGRTVDCELAWSPDSVKWERVAAGVPFIPRGEKESYDGGCIYAQAGAPVVKDHEMWIYYGGSREVHQGWKRHCLPCLARLRLDGFAGYEPTDAVQPGLVTTQPLRCVGEPLRVSADARGGALRVEVVGVEGYSFADCEPISADVTDGEVRWKNGRSLAALKGRDVPLQFELRGARLYAFAGLELPAAR